MRYGISTLDVTFVNKRNRPENQNVLIKKSFIRKRKKILHQIFPSFYIAPYNCVKSLVNEVLIRKKTKTKCTFLDRRDIPALIVFLFENVSLKWKM
jgi:hypothetical protein